LHHPKNETGKSTREIFQECEQSWNAGRCLCFYGNNFCAPEYTYTVDILVLIKHNTSIMQSSNASGKQRWFSHYTE